MSLLQLAKQMPQAQFAIGVDTGLSHLAAALGIPVVAIYTDTEPAFTGVARGRLAAAVNVGGKAQVPSVPTVIAAVSSVLPAVSGQH